MNRWYRKYIGEEQLRFPAIENDVFPLSKVLWIFGFIVFCGLLVMGSISYGKAQNVSLGPPVSEVFAPAQRSTALELTRISASTGVDYGKVFEVYKQNLELVRTFDKGWNSQFALFDRLWNARCFEPEGPVCDRDGPIVLNGTK